MADFDIESQQSSASRAEEGPPVEWVGTTLSPAKAASWERNIGSKPEGPRGHYNPHGLLAAQRYVSEQFACHELLANTDAIVVDVGAAPHRTYGTLLERGRYMMPNVHLGDRARVSRCPPAAVQYICHHKFEECSCFQGKPHAFLFTHSAYYLDPMVLHARLREELCKDAIAVEHSYDDVFGGYYDEATWQVSEGIVTMQVKGNNNPYSHRLPPWQTGWVGPGGEMIAAATLKVLDDCTRVVRLEAVMSNYQPCRSLVWGEVESGRTHEGPVQFSSAVKSAVADNARFTHATFDVQKVWQIGPFIYTDLAFRGDVVRVTMPVNGVSQVAAHVVNRPRTPELYAEVTHIMRNRWSRARIPPQLLANTISAVVALGFVINLNHEIDVTHTMTSRFSWAFKAHQTLLQFGVITTKWWRYALMLVLLVVLAIVVADVLDPNTDERVAITVLPLVVLALTWVCCWNAVKLHRSFRAYQEAGWVARVTDEEGPRAPLLGQGFTLAMNLPLPASRYVRPPIQKGLGSVSLDTTRERVVEPARQLVSGIVLDGAVPTALHTGQKEELCAVTNRILIDRTNPEPAALERYVVNMRNALFWSKKRFSVDTSLVKAKQWFLKLKDSYPASYVVEMEKTWMENQGTMPPPQASKPFLKIELAAATVGIDDAKAVKARLIQPPEDVDKAMTGPAVWQLWKHFREMWNGVTSKVMYCSGYTTRVIGEAVDGFLERHNGKVVCWSVDMASYDATLGMDLQQPVFDLYVKKGMPAWLVSWLKRTRSRGKTPNGVKYSPQRVYTFDTKEEAEEYAEKYRKDKFMVQVIEGSEEVEGLELVYVTKWYVLVEDFQMTSGRMDTNLTDTVALVTALTAVLPEIDFLLLACGDDGALFLPMEAVGLVEEIMRFCQSLGLKPEGKVSEKRSDWEFCSKLFWFADIKGKPCTVLGSKPFRGIARMGSKTTLPGAANAAQAALSVRIDSGHVPFLAPFADRTTTLCAKQKIRPTGKVEWTAIHGDVRYVGSDLNYLITQERYGLGKESEEEFKHYLADLNSVPIVLGWMPALDAVRVDEA